MTEGQFLACAVDVGRKFPSTSTFLVLLKRLFVGLEPQEGDQLADLREGLIALRVGADLVLVLGDGFRLFLQEERVARRVLVQQVLVGHFFASGFALCFWVASFLMVLTASYGLSIDFYKKLSGHRASESASGVVAWCKCNCGCK